MFEKLLEYTIGSVIKRCDFNEHQKHLEEKCKNQIEVNLRSYLTKAFAQHSQNSVNATNTLKQSVDSSVEFYTKEMQENNRFREFI